MKFHQTSMPLQLVLFIKVTKNILDKSCRKLFLYIIDYNSFYRKTGEEILQKNMSSTLIFQNGGMSGSWPSWKTWSFHLDIKLSSNAVASLSLNMWMPLRICSWRCQIRDTALSGILKSTNFRLKLLRN